LSVGGNSYQLSARGAGLGRFFTIAALYGCFFHSTLAAKSAARMGHPLLYTPVKMRPRWNAGRGGDLLHRAIGNRDGGVAGFSTDNPGFHRLGACRKCKRLLFLGSCKGVSELERQGIALSCILSRACDTLIKLLSKKEQESNKARVRE